MPKIDFKALADAALSHAESLLGEWLPQGRRDGHEWKSVNPMRADNSAGSFSININTGVWGDFATDDKGGDLVSLCAYLFHSGAQLEAAYDVAERIGYSLPKRRAQNARNPPKIPLNETPVETPAPKEKAKRSPWVPLLPVPSDAPVPPVAHVVRGKPERTWCYRNAVGGVLGFVWRFVTSDGGKEVLPLTFCQHETTGKREWRGLSFPDPRPLYGLDRLAEKPDATVLIVEGEKCADVAHEQLPDLAVVSWPGGGKAVDKAGWVAIGDRKVVIWPDCDAQRDKKTEEILPEHKQPGWKAALRIAEILHGHGCKVWTVRIPKPGEKPSGWDVADAVEEGLTGESLSSWMRDRLTLATSESISTAEEAGASSRDAAAEPPDEDWERRLIYTKEGNISSVLMNVHDILLNSPQWQGVIAFDEFAQRTVKRKPPPFHRGEIGDWSDNDDTQTSIWLGRVWGFSPDTKIVGKAIEALARAHSFHPVKDWFKSLPAWDGTRRLDMWLIDHAGVADSEYVRLVSRFTMLGIVNRIMRPGCKFDTCLVMEGEQGKKKSTIARVLGGEWFGDTDLDLTNKDSMIALAGKMVYELAEMGSVARSDAARQKSFLSRQFDELRLPYGNRMVKFSRQVVFFGTTNEDEWNKDLTGGRRFWPVKCVGEINPEGLAVIRDQLFSEALVAFEAGERYWPTDEEQRRLFNPEQAQREQQESYVDALHDWVYAAVCDFSMAEAAMTGLKLDASKLTRDLQTRIGNALRKLGCQRIEKRNGMVRYWYRPPQLIEGGTQSANASGGSGYTPSPSAPGEHRVPF